MGFSLIDGVKIWEPSDRQISFIRIPDSVFEGFYGGAAGGGKSELLLTLPIIRGWYKNYRFRGILFRKTFPQLEESLIPRSKELYEPLGAKYNDQKHYWTFPGGATIRFSYMLRDEDARDHDTAEYHYAAFDELTAFTEFQYLYITSRVRSSDPSLPALIRSASNPGNIGHIWVRKRFVDPSPFGNKLIYDSVTDQKRIFIPAKLSDNPYLNKIDPGYANRLWLLPEAERKAKLDGDWYTFSGMVFTEWREHPYRDEPSNACHVVDDFDVPVWWPRIAAIDWGFKAHTWIGWAALAPNGRCYLYREYFQTGKYIEEWGADFARLSQREKLERVFIDPSANQKRGDPKTIQTQFYEASGYNAHLADNDRISGKLLLHEFLRWKPKPPKIIPKEGFDNEFAQTILRIYGTKAYHDYLSLFESEEPETNIPRIQVFRSCEAIRAVIPVCQYVERKTDKVVEDVAEFDGDDPYDGIRYVVKGIDSFLDKAERKSNELKTYDNILSNLTTTSASQTTFHRRMEVLESKVSNSPKPIRQFHSARHRRRRSL